MEGWKNGEERKNGRTEGRQKRCREGRKVGRKEGRRRDEGKKGENE
jgi:hypothetical protein